MCDSPRATADRRDSGLAWPAAATVCVRPVHVALTTFHALRTSPRSFTQTVSR
jgi:hypothetical protein